MKEPTLADFDKLLREIAAIVLERVQGSMKRKKWVRAIYDARSDGIGGRLGKLRVEMPNGSTITSLNMGVDALVRVNRLWSMREKVFPEIWHGLKMVIFPNGKCETEFNYDPDCFYDATFIDITK
jgi:hypothetical protein